MHPTDWKLNTLAIILLVFVGEVRGTEGHG